MTSIVQPLEIRSVVDQVYVALRARILSGELPSGSRLHQTTLSDELGVSRTPLREALRRLSTEGLVELEANRGATVARRELADLRHAWQARLVIEPPAARLAAGVRVPAAIERMQAAVERQRQVFEDVSESFAVNRAFHHALIEATGNPHLVQFSQMLWLTRIGSPIFRGQAEAGPKTVLRWADDHDAIAAAVAQGRGALAERLTRKHIVDYPVPSETDAA